MYGISGSYTHVDLICNLIYDNTCSTFSRIPFQGAASYLDIADNCTQISIRNNSTDHIKCQSDSDSSWQNHHHIPVIFIFQDSTYR